MKLFDEYRDSPERTNFKEQWRQEENETKLQKMLVSLGRRMPWLRNSLLKSQEQEQEQEKEKEHNAAVVASIEDGENATELVAETPAVTVVAIGGEAAIMDPEILPTAVTIEDEKTVVEEEDSTVLAAIEAEVLVTPSSTDSSSESMEGVESTVVPQMESEKGGEKVENEDVEVEFELEAKADEAKAESVSRSDDEEEDEEEDKDVSLDVGETDVLEAQSKDQGQGMERSLSNASSASAVSASSASSVSSSLSSSSATSSSHQSQGSSKAWAAATFGGLIKDPFLALVEQELSGWESVVG